MFGPYQNPHSPKKPLFAVCEVVEKEKSKQPVAGMVRMKNQTVGSQSSDALWSNITDSPTHSTSVKSHNPDFKTIFILELQKKIKIDFEKTEKIKRLKAKLKAQLKKIQRATRLLPRPPLI